MPLLLLLLVVSTVAAGDAPLSVPLPLPFRAGPDSPGGWTRSTCICQNARARSNDTRGDNCRLHHPHGALAQLICPSAPSAPALSCSCSCFSTLPRPASRNYASSTGSLPVRSPPLNREPCARRVGDAGCRYRCSVVCEYADGERERAVVDRLVSAAACGVRRATEQCVTNNVGALN